MKVTDVALVLVLIAAACAGCGSMGRDVLPSAGFVRGTVSDSETSLPIDSVHILFKINASYTSSFGDGYTDTLGCYLLFSGPHNGRLYLEATKDGYRSYGKYISIIAIDTIMADFSLEKE